MEVDFRPSEEKSRLKRLDEIINHIGLTASWFTDPALLPGQWTAFESRLYYLTAGTPFLPDLLLFAAPEEPPTIDPSGVRIRFLLHGSLRHLTGGSPSEVLHQGGSSSALDFLSHISRLLRNLDERSLSVQPPEDREQPKRRIWWATRSKGISERVSESPLAATDYNRIATRDLLNALDARPASDTAAWMSGYARISANIVDRKSFTAPVRYLIASPLYVERSAPPKDL